MLYKIIIGLFILGLFTKCNDSNVKEGLFNQSSELNIKALIADTVKKDSQIYIPIILNNPIYKLHEVVLNCNVTETTTADTSKFILFPKHTHLVISYDTAKFWLNTGANIGQFTNSAITIIVKGQDNRFFYQKVLFDYYVK